ncbi:hypothetical protein CEK28_08900 [Xenophilus sp. AP218F]|nr:hypothetical protein CEK28_08900 [Xenophilus sp. AP218F]
MRYSTFYRVAQGTNGLDLSGSAAEQYGGRFNPAGTPAIYASSSIALAILEVMVQSHGIRPLACRVMALQVPSTGLPRLQAKDLPLGWNSRHDQSVAQNVAHRHLFANGLWGLRIPSVVIPEEFNLVLNPRHPHMQTISVVELQTFDPDLLTAPNKSAQMGADLPSRPKEWTAMLSKQFAVYAALSLPPDQKILAIRQGFPAKDLSPLLGELEMSKRQLLSVLGLSERHGARLFESERQLNANASERLLRLVEVMVHAEAVFGDSKSARKWLTTQNLSLFARPVDMLDTEFGTNQVRRALLSIEHGLPL